MRGRSGSPRRPLHRERKGRKALGARPVRRLRSLRRQRVPGSSASQAQEAGAKQFDLGLQGLGILIGISLIFGVVAQLILRGGTRWLWLFAAIGWFVGGLFASEVLFATATEDEIQPIIDGLALDESLLGGLIVGIIVAVVTRLLTGPSPFRRRATF